jgi:outer membrane protein assembly factor BamB
MTIGRRFAAAVLAGAVVLGGAGLAVADVAKDWPQFRGPVRDGLSKETGLLKQWPQGGPPLAWKGTGIGDGHSSVSVANGKIYTTGKEGESVYAFAVNEADGKPVWKAKIGGLANNSEGQGGKGSRSTPTVDGDMVYVEGPIGEVVALTAADGKEQWRASMTKDFGGKVPQWGFSDSLLVHGDHVITVPGGRQGTVVALDKKTGKEVWRSKDLTEPAHYVSPIVAQIGGVEQIVVSTEKTVAGLSPKDGAVLWRAQRKGRVAVIPTPIVHEDHVYVAAGYGEGEHLFKVTKEGNAFTAKEVYAKKNMVNHHGGVILLNGNLYGYSDGKGWVCQDLMSGEIKWRDKDVCGKGTIAHADGNFYLRDEKKGTIVLIEANPEKLVEKGRFEQPEPSGKPYWPYLVIANGKLYVRDMDNLFCYDIKAKS